LPWKSKTVLNIWGVFSVFLPHLSGMQTASFPRRFIRHLSHVRLYNISPHYLGNGTIFGKFIGHKLRYFIFSTTFV